MKVTIILFLFLILASVSNAQHINKSKFEIVYQPISVTNSDTTFHGKVVDHIQKKTSYERIYYWYLKNKIHQNHGGHTGKVLHGESTTFDKDDNLIVQGEFFYGLKNKKWVYWDNQGNITKREFWHRGLLKKELFYENKEITQKEKHKNALLNVLF